MFITVAVAATVVVLVFARDVSRAAHGASASRASEDLSFAALANALVGQENAFDARLARLVTSGAGLRRSVFAARLAQLAQQLPGWSVEAEQLRYPALARDVNVQLYAITTERVAAYHAVLADVATALALPWSAAHEPNLTAATTSLLASSTRWDVERFALVKEPGRARLTATTTLAATTLARSGVVRLAHARSLSLVRAVAIAAVRVSPASLPTGPAQWLLPPVSSVGLGVSVVNDGYDLQPVSLTIRVTPLTRFGAPFTQTMTTTLAPLGAYAFVPHRFATLASERARVVITVNGAPAAPGRATTETVRLVMSPSGGA